MAVRCRYNVVNRTACPEYRPRGKCRFCGGIGGVLLIERERELLRNANLPDDEIKAVMGEGE